MLKYTYFWQRHLLLLVVPVVEVKDVSCLSSSTGDLLQRHTDILPLMRRPVPPPTHTTSRHTHRLRHTHIRQCLRCPIDSSSGVMHEVSAFTFSIEASLSCWDPFVRVRVSRAPRAGVMDGESGPGSDRFREKREYRKGRICEWTSLFISFKYVFNIVVFTTTRILETLECFFNLNIIKTKRI